MPNVKKALEEAIGPLTANDGSRYRSLHMFYDTASQSPDVLKYLYSRLYSEEETYYAYESIRVTCRTTKDYDYLLIFAL